ncbi:MAG: GerMN domain-containing protein [Oscillatoriales cyanobacterium SM2_2_1]|nr:GerMN domain-containing protein [Oscillatoriales cyanobacterium SM2_2_1]
MNSSTWPKSIWIGLMITAIAGGTTVAILSQQIQNPSATQPILDAPVERTVEVYWLESRRNRLVAVPRRLKSLSEASTLRQVLVEMVAKPPQEPNLYSAIPQNVKILNLAVQGQDIRLDLSREFLGGGGSATMQGRVIQILYTATSLNPDARLFLSVEGQPLFFLGGEGLEIKQPLTRNNFAVEF